MLMRLFMFNIKNNHFFSLQNKLFLYYKDVFRLDHAAIP